MRNKCGLKGANSTEFDPKTEHPVVGLIEEWIDRDGNLEERDENSDLGGTMRLGAQDCHLLPGSQAHQVYCTELIRERHRHRYEVNINYRPCLESAGLVIGGYRLIKILLKQLSCRSIHGLLVSFTPNLHLLQEMGTFSSNS